MASNERIRLILRLRGKIPQRQVDLLLALETFTADEDGWRTVGVDLIAHETGISPRTIAKARGELVAADWLDFARGDGRGHVSGYRTRLPSVPKGSKNAATFKGRKNAATFPAAKGGKPAPVKVANGPDKGGTRNPAASANANRALKELALKPSAAHARETSRRLHNRDPRLVLLGLDETVTDAEAEAIAAALEADPDVRDPFAYLLAISAAGPQQIGEFLGRMRRQLAADEPSAERPAKPPWCGECDERTRLAELPDGGMTRCIRCHPLAQTRPAAPEPPCDEPGCDGHGWIETGDGTVRRCPNHGYARQTRQHANNSPDTPRAARLADDLRDLVHGLDGDHKLTDAEVESIVAHDMTDPRFRDDPLASIYDAVIDWNEHNPAEGTP
jgi:hypothetical protein